MEEIDRVNVLDVGISVLNLSIAEKAIYKGVDKAGFQGFITITGVHGVVESQYDDELKRIHNRSFLTTPDGMPMVWLGKWQGQEEMDRVYGPELMLNIMESSSQGGHGHYFFGGAEGVADELRERLSKRYTGLNIVGTMCPPFRPLTDEEEQTLHDEIQLKKPHFVWVGLSTPKQERFMHNFLAKYPDLTKDWDHGLVMLGVGAAFDFHSGKVKQAPYWVQRSGFEWLYRTIREPQRLLLRYVKANSLFVWKIIPQILGWKKYKLKK